MAGIILHPLVNQWGNVCRYCCSYSPYILCSRW